MSQYGPTPTPQPQPQPPGAPRPDPPHPDHRNARIAIISLIVTSVLTIIGIVVSVVVAGPRDLSGGSTPTVQPETHTPKDDPVTLDPTTPDPTTPGEPTTATPEETTTPTPDDSEDDGLTSAERQLRDSLNDEQWQRESCVSESAAGGDAAVTCAVTSESPITGDRLSMKATVVVYPSKAEQQKEYRSYSGSFPEGSCAESWNVRDSWYESEEGELTGDMVCSEDGLQYAIVCTYYERDVIFLATGTDPQLLVEWWYGLDPIFTD